MSAAAPGSDSRWPSPGALLADLAHVANATTPDETLDRLCAILCARGEFGRAAALLVLPGGVAFGSAGLSEAERTRHRASLSAVGPLERGRSRVWVLANCRLAPEVDICFVPIELRPSAEGDCVSSPTTAGPPGERWEAGDELVLLPHGPAGESLGCIDLAGPANGRRPTLADVRRLSELLEFAGHCLKGLDVASRSHDRGREEARRVIGYVEGLSAVPDLDTLFEHLAETCAHLAGYRVAVLTAHLEDGPHLGTCNLSPSEIEAFRHSMRGSTAEGTAAKRQRIRQMAFPGTAISFVPHTAELSRGGAYRSSGPSELHSWHPDDRLFILMPAGGGRDIGVLSLDEPLTGHAPHAQALGPLRLAERFLALGGAMVEARLLQTHVLRARRLEALGTLAAGVAHDFNNLIGVILGYASLLRLSSHDAASSARTAVQIEDACRRAAGLTGRLREFARVRSPVREGVALCALVRDVAQRLGSAQGRATKLHLDLPADLPSIAGDGRELTRCVESLCSNALEAAGSDGNVWISARADEGLGLLGEPTRRYVRLMIEDDGPGIPEDLRERVFEPFFSTRSREDHDGLGLFIAFAIVRAHGGTLEMLRRPEGGASVRLILPLPLPAQEGPASPPPGWGGTRAGAARRGGPVHLLVVEDEPGLQDVVRQALAALGHTCQIAADGEEALDVLERGAEPFDAILLDLVLPRRSGIEVFRRARVLRPDLPVILSSGNVEEGLLHPDLATGISAALPKPWSVGDLERALDRVLRSRGRALGPSSPS